MKSQLLAVQERETESANVAASNEKHQERQQKQANMDLEFISARMLELEKTLC